MTEIRKITTVLVRAVTRLIGDGELVVKAMFNALEEAGVEMEGHAVENECGVHATWFFLVLCEPSEIDECVRKIQRHLATRTGAAVVTNWVDANLVVFPNSAVTEKPPLAVVRE